MALLQQLLVKSPPIVEVSERKRPIFYPLIVKKKVLFAKLSNETIYIFKGDPQLFDHGEDV